MPQRRHVLPEHTPSETLLALSPLVMQMSWSQVAQSLAFILWLWAALREREAWRLISMIILPKHPGLSMRIGKDSLLVKERL